MSTNDNAGLVRLDDVEWVQQTTFNEDSIVEGFGRVTGNGDAINHVGSSNGAVQQTMDAFDNNKHSAGPNDVVRSVSVNDDARIPEIVRRQVMVPVRFSTVVWAMAVVVVSIAVFASVLTPTILTVGQTAMDVYVIVIYSISIVCLLVLLFLGMTKRLHASHELRHDRRAIVFYKIGIVVLGTGSIVFNLVHIVTHATEEGLCKNGIVQSSLAIAFIILEVILFLSFSKTTINNGLVISLIGLLMTAQLIGTNISAWIYSVVVETQEGMHTGSSTNSSSGTHSSSGDTGSTGTSEPATSTCQKLSALEQSLVPYLFPLTVEYSVLAMTIAVGMWEKCGWQKPEFFIAPPEDSRSDDGHSGSDVSVKHKHERRSSSASSDQTPRYHNHHVGFALGWMIILGSIVIIMIFLYFLYAGSGSQSATLNTVALSWDIAVKSLCVIALTIAMIQVRQLTVKTSHMIVRRRLRDNRPMSLEGISKINKRLDEILLIITFFALFVSQVFKMIAFGYVNDGLVVADTALTIVEGIMQTIFVVAYADSRRSTTEEHLLKKPGRQCLELLRIANLAMWCLETFLIKQSTDRSSNPVLTSSSWTAVSNVAEPLAILFYFHSIGMFGELIHHVYTKKYIGLADDLPALTHSGFGSVSINTDMDSVPTAIVLVRSPSKQGVSKLPRSVSTSSIYYTRQSSRMSTMKQMDSIQS